MTLQEAHNEGDIRWRHLGLGRGWHMYPGTEKEHFRLEWPDGVMRGVGKSWESAFAAADLRGITEGARR